MPKPEVVEYEEGDIGKEVTKTYYVVFEGVGGDRSNYAGIRTMTGYKSKEDFERHQRQFPNRDLVIGQDLTLEEATKLCSQTTMKASIQSMMTEIEEHPNRAEVVAVNTAFLMWVNAGLGD